LRRVKVGPLEVELGRPAESYGAPSSRLVASSAFR
jgi:hypothetical protein